MTGRISKSLTFAAVSGLFLLSGCGGSVENVSAPTSASVVSESGLVVTKFDVVSELEPLAKAVVAYTSTDYGQATDLTSASTVSRVESDLQELKVREQTWFVYASSVDFARSAIPGLEAAVSKYNSSVKEWHENQDQALANWKRCIDAGGEDLELATCMLAGHSIEGEQEVLARYSASLQSLLATLGVSVT